jgi:hypothetical protein
VLTSDVDKAEAFNDYFKSVFSATDTTSLCTANPALRSHDVDFSPAAVFEALKHAKHSTSLGPDGFPSVLWANLADVLAFPISIIFTLSYKHASLPYDWKCALVRPLHKKVMLA